MPGLEKHILLIRFSSLGDVAMTVPVIAAFLDTYPNCKISVLTKKQFAPIFSHLSQVEVIFVNFKEEFKGVKGLFKLAKKIQDLKVDAIADLHNVLRTKILRFLLPGHTFLVLDKGRSQKQKLIRGSSLEPLRPMPERYADVFRGLGFEISLSNPRFPKPLSLPKTAKKQLENCKKPFIGIAPFAAYTSKMYPLKKTENVVSHLSRKYSVLLFGGGNYEVKMIDEMVQKFPAAVSVAGKYTLEEEIKLMSHLNLMLAMDSGNAHMAAMMGVKVITLWGVTHPFLGFKPFNQSFENCLLSDAKKYPKIPTSVYGDKYPKDYEKVMDSIAVEDVLEAVERAL